ncbi:hypothetical protein LOTGIDRAFT_71752, partial [Lottia gigantea]
DINIGIVIPIHRYDRYNICSSQYREVGSFQRVQAAIFAIDEINNKTTLLPNIKLGYTLMDDCSKDTTALARTLHFIQEANKTRSEDDEGLVAYDVVGVIGTESSRNSVQMADMLSIFRVPILSYLSTSPILSDKNVYPYFSRIVPSDVLQAKVIVDVLAHFGWEYISVIYAEGSYGTLGFQAVKKRIDDIGSCLAVTTEMRQSFSDDEYDDIIKSLKKAPRAKAVVIFAPLAQTRALMKAVDRMNASGDFTWIGSDAWGRNIQDYDGIEKAALGAITIKFYSPSVKRFDDSFMHLSVKSAPENPWIKHFVEAHNNCKFDATGNTAACNDTMNFVPNYKQEVTVSLVMDAVYAYALAMNKTLSECPTGSTSPRLCFNGSDLVEALRSVTFNGEHGKVAFNSEGDGVAVYELQNFQLVNGEYVLRPIGLWDSEVKNFTTFSPENILWNPLLTLEKNNLPKSTCSDPCEAGYQQVVTQPHCCWYCQKCRDNERTVMREGLAKCDICPKQGNYTWPDEETKESCVNIEPTIVKVQDFTGALIVSFDIVTIMLAILVTVFYILNNQEKLIKASSRELSYLILVGVFLSSIFVTFFVVYPTDFTCTVTDLGFHLSFSFSYGPLLIKTNRIYRIFTSGKKSKARPPFIESKYQMSFAIITILVQVKHFFIDLYFFPAATGLGSLPLIIVTTFTIMDNPKAVAQMPSFAERYVEITCQLPEIGFLCSLTYNMLLVLLCTFHAIKTRKLPDNFNESKFISFCVYTTIVLWLAFIPTYFTTTKTNYKAMFLSLAMLANSLVTLCFLFLPKLYAL